MRSVMVLSYLVILAIWDIKEKKIPVWILIVGTVCGGICGLGFSHEKQWELVMMCMAVMPGIFLVIIARLTQKAGAGDGWALVNIGLVESYKICIFLLGISLMIMALVSGVLLFLHKVNKNTKLPYLPFLMLAYLCKFLL